MKLCEALKRSADRSEILRPVSFSAACSTIVGDGNVNTQISGNQNQVWGRGQG